MEDQNQPHLDISKLPDDIRIRFFEAIAESVLRMFRDPEIRAELMSEKRG